jgi:hypothetical protein
MKGSASRAADLQAVARLALFLLVFERFQRERRETMAGVWIVDLDAPNPNKIIVSYSNQTTRWFLRISNRGPSDINLGGLDGIAPGDTRTTDAGTGFEVRLVRLGTDPNPRAAVQIEVLGQGA